MVFFRVEREIGVFAVVAGKRQITEAIEPSFLHSLPIISQQLPPFDTKILVLRHDVLYRIGTRVGQVIFVTIILKALQQMPAYANAVKILVLECTFEFLVRRGKR